jgi:hypothetical protein
VPEGLTPEEQKARERLSNTIMMYAVAVRGLAVDLKK